MKLLAILTIMMLPYPLYETGNTVLFPELVMLLSNWLVMCCLVTQTHFAKCHQVGSSWCEQQSALHTVLGCVACGHRPLCCSPAAMECPYTAHDCTRQHITGPLPSLNLLLSLKSNSWLTSSLMKDLIKDYILIFFKASSCIIIFLSI